MQNDQQRLEELLQQAEWSAGDKAWLLSYLKRSSGDELEQLQRRLFDQSLEDRSEINREVAERMLQRITTSTGMQQLEEDKKVHQLPVLRTRWYWVAAAMALLLAGVFYYNQRSDKNSDIAVVKPKPALPQDVAPGGNRAVLTLADGRIIPLDSLANGQLATQQTVTITKLADGQLQYRVNGTAGADETMFNTISVPRGGEYTLTLEDGTRVWLNSSSTLRYPVRFTGKERMVTVSGEAYFDVAKVESAAGKKPFIVEVAKANGLAGRVEVLGTEFNINAYEDEATVQTTLVEGTVRMFTPAQTAGVTLQPGQQAAVRTGTDKITVSNADVDAVIAWKNGLFQFNRADIQTIMRQIARWYDVEVVIEGDLPARRFVGKVPRNNNVSEVLQILELSNIHFRIVGKKIYVYP